MRAMQYLVIICFVLIGLSADAFAEEKNSEDRYEKIVQSKRGITITRFQKDRSLPKGTPFLCHMEIQCKGYSLKNNVKTASECIDILNGKSWSDEEGVCLTIPVTTTEGRRTEGVSRYMRIEQYDGSKKNTFFKRNRDLPKGTPFLCYKTTQCEGEILGKNVEDIQECVIGLNGDSWSDAEGVCLTGSIATWFTCMDREKK